MSIASKFLQAQKEIKAVVPDAANPFFKSKYASYDAVVDAVKGPLNKAGLVFSHTSRFTDNIYFVGTILIDAETDEKTAAFEMPVKVGNSQETGSALSYAKRYTLAAITALPTSDDDDGNAASHPAASAPATGSAEKKPFTGQVSTTAAATEKQINFLRGKSTERGWTPAEVMDAAKAMAPALVSLKDLTKAQASKLIETVSNTMPMRAEFDPGLPPDDLEIPFG